MPFPGGYRFPDPRAPANPAQDVEEIARRPHWLSDYLAKPWADRWQLDDAELYSILAEVSSLQERVRELEGASADNIAIADQALAIVQSERDQAVKDCAWEQRRAETAEATVERMRKALTGLERGATMVNGLVSNVIGAGTWTSQADAVYALKQHMFKSIFAADMLLARAALSADPATPTEEERFERMTEEELLAGLDVLLGKPDPATPRDGGT